MKTIVFSILVLAQWAFLYKLIDKLPRQSEMFLDRAIQLIPSFDGDKADIKSFAFCFLLLAFVALVALVIFT